MNYLKKLVTAKNILLWIGAFAVVIVAMIGLSTKIDVSFAVVSQPYYYVHTSLWAFIFDGTVEGSKFSGVGTGKAPFIHSKTSLLLFWTLVIALCIIGITFIPNKGGLRGLKMALVIILSVVMFFVLLIAVLGVDKPNFNKAFNRLSDAERLEIGVQCPSVHIVDGQNNVKGLILPALLSCLVTFVGAVFGGFKDGKLGQTKEAK